MTPACTRYPPDWWHRDLRKRRGQPLTGDSARAKHICLTECPLATQCLADALKAEAGIGTQYRWGIWGGTTPDERAALARGTR
jgi:hypothetical protein